MPIMLHMNKTVIGVTMMSSLVLSGCVAVGLTALGVGMATGVSHTLSGMVYKTFTTPQAQVKRATYGALNRMQIRVIDTNADRGVLLGAVWLLVLLT